VANQSSSTRSPDLSDPRYLDEIGFFLYYEKEMRWDIADYGEERRQYSKLHLEEVLEAAGADAPWITDKRVLNIGSGCSCGVMAWPCLSKTSIDPLIDVYAKLGMLLDDEPGTPVTTPVVASAEDIPLAEGSIDLSYCRNALDHMYHPQTAVEEIARVTAIGGYLYLDVDLDGDPTPDEPSSLKEEEVLDWLAPWFELKRKWTDLKPFSINSRGRMRVFLQRNKRDYSPRIDKDALYAAYLQRIESDKDSL